MAGSITLNLSYRNPETDLLESNPIAPAEFTPLRTIDFHGLSDGQSVVSTANDPGSVAGKRWDSVLGNKGFFGGYGVQASTTVKMSGKTSSCRMTIKEGSDGDPSGGDTGTPYGAFGGKLHLQSGEEVVQGGSLWFGLWVYIPSAFSFETNVGFLKTFRISQSNGSARLDYHAASGNWDGSAADGTQIGWNMGNEMDASPQEESIAKSSIILPRDQWTYAEVYVKAHSDPAQAIRRIWVDGVMAYELNGNIKKYINQAGTLVTTALGSGRITLPTAVDYLTDMIWCTYWNGYSPIDNTMYVQSVGYTTSANPPTATDAYGNLMMGVGAI